MKRRWMILPLFTLLLLLFVASVSHALYIKITNIGTMPLTDITLSFDFAPFDGLNPFVLDSPGIPDRSNIYFPPGTLTIQNPIPPGETIDTYLIPELTDESSEIIVISIAYRSPEGLFMGYGAYPHWGVVENSTVIDFISPNSLIGARLSFLSGGHHSPCKWHKGALKCPRKK